MGERQYLHHIRLSIERLIWGSRLNIFHMMFQKNQVVIRTVAASPSVFCLLGCSESVFLDEKSASNRVWISIANTKHKFGVHYFLLSCNAYRREQITHEEHCGSSAFFARWASDVNTSPSVHIPLSLLSLILRLSFLVQPARAPVLPLRPISSANQPTHPARVDIFINITWNTYPPQVTCSHQYTTLAY